MQCEPRHTGRLQALFPACLDSGCHLQLVWLPACQASHALLCAIFINFIFGVSMTVPCTHKWYAGCRIGLPIKASEPGYTDWLYLDEELRISRGNKGSLFIHTRLPRLPA